MRESLGHKDRSDGMTAAERKARRLRESAEVVRRGEVTTRQLLNRYLRAETPAKSKQARKADHRFAELARSLDPVDEVVTEIDTQAWRASMRERASEAIDCRGDPVPEGERTEVGARTVEADMRRFRAVYNWAMTEKVNGQRFLHANPLDGVEIPREESPQRAPIPRPHYEAMLEVAPEVHARLPLMLTLAWETSRRIKEIRRLQYRDVLLDRGNRGAIHWRGAEHKEALDDVVPVSGAAREAVLEHLQQAGGEGRAWLFPHPERPENPPVRWFPEKWFGAAEDAANLGPIPGVKWHGMRRAFATRLLGRGVFPSTVARLGGWRSVETVLEIYARPGEKAMEEALEMATAG